MGQTVGSTGQGRTAYERWGWRPILTEKYRDGPGKVALLIGLFCFSLPGLIPVMAIVAFAMGEPIAMDRETWFTVLMFLLLPPLFGTLFLKIARDIRIEHRLVKGSIGKGIVAGVAGSKGIVKRMLSTQGIEYEKMLGRKWRFTIGRAVSTGSEAYSIYGGRLHVLALNLDDITTGLNMHSVILIGPFETENLEHIYPMCKAIDSMLEDSGIDWYPLETYIERYAVSEQLKIS